LQRVFPGILADAFIRYRTVIIAPSQSGKYVFQTILIQSGWLESVEPEILHEFDVDGGRI
jgi:hypothetical protein